MDFGKQAGMNLQREQCGPTMASAGSSKSEIGELFDQQEHLLSVLDDAIQQLANRLEPLRISRPTTAAPTPNPSPVQSTIGQVIYQSNRKVDSAISKLRELRDELAL